jgi:hypothetical protein
MWRKLVGNDIVYQAIVSEGNYLILVCGTTASVIKGFPSDRVSQIVMTCKGRSNGQTFWWLSPLLQANGKYDS